MKLYENFNIATISKAINLMGKKKGIYLTFIFVFCSVEIMCTILYTKGIKGVIASFSENNQDMFWHGLLLIILNYSIWWIYAPISTYVCDLCSKGSMQQIKTDLCEHIIALPMSYHDKKSKAEFLSIVSNDTVCLQKIYDWSFFQVLRSSLGGVCGVIIMFVIDWRFASVVLILGVLCITISSYFSRKLEKIGSKLQQQLSNSSTDAYELVKAAKTIRLFGLLEDRMQNFFKSTKLEADAKMEAGKVSSKMNAILVAISALSYILILFIGALFVHFGLLDWGSVIALTGLKYTADMLFLECGQFMAGMQTNVAGVKRIFEITDTPKQEIINDKTFSIKESASPLSVNAIRFSYDNTTNIINNFSMVVEDNRLTTLVGESGSGKSTIMKLLLALYEPQEGNITFDGQQTTTLEHLRSKTAYVPQDTMLFRGSIYENIAFGNENARRQDIILAAKQSGADEFISHLEKGYDTVILDDGKSLSGGQKQRIAIARALVKNAEILLLDEITSALDKSNEERILKTIKAISKTKAVLFITHKTNVANWSDRIYTIGHRKK
jgi:ATP-binding cassette subfamily B protein